MATPATGVATGEAKAKDAADRDPFGLVAACRALSASLATVQSRTAALAASAAEMRSEADQMTAGSDRIVEAVDRLKQLTRRN